ncbi:MAG: tRNA dihydrouridine synthase DusB [Acidimicrobiia bacterium]|nr:tRNA dihydrouridine synthase DusB [Acidimicrobiia bacterium]MCC5954386.1 tRNA dihydrouridine synthase DusB [Acidimicrobiia bacterium]
MTLSIGPLRLDPPVVLAPMAGVTNVAFRRLCRQFGAGLYVSEMVTARALVEGNERTRRMVARDDGEPTHSVQLYSVHPEVLARAVRILIDDIGVDHVDLNFGCPAPKVTRRGGGAALPLHPRLLQRLVESAVGSAGRVPVTVKMRMGIDDSLRTDIEAARIAEDAGAAAVALHARTAVQLYSGEARWEAIAELRASVRSIPVLGNGDIWRAEDALAMHEATGCDGVVIGRGCLGRPWLFRDLACAYAGEPIPPPPTFGETVATMREHLELLCAHLGGLGGVRDFRKHLAWYLVGYPVGRARRHELNRANDPEVVDALLARLLDVVDPDLRLDPVTATLPRGHTNGPRPVALPDGWLDSRHDDQPPAGAELLVSGG